jgi:hypothetical protein
MAADRCIKRVPVPSAEKVEVGSAMSGVGVVSRGQSTTEGAPSVFGMEVGCVRDDATIDLMNWRDLAEI